MRRMKSATLSAVKKAIGNDESRKEMLLEELEKVSKLFRKALKSKDWKDANDHSEYLLTLCHGLYTITGLKDFKTMSDLMIENAEHTANLIESERVMKQLGVNSKLHERLQQKIDEV